MLFGLLGLVLAALLTPAVAVQPRPGPVFSVLAAPGSPVIGVNVRLIAPSPAVPDGGPYLELGPRPSSPL